MKIKASTRPPFFFQALEKVRLSKAIRSTGLKAFTFLLYSILIFYASVSVIHFELLNPAAFVEAVSAAPGTIKNQINGWLFGQAEQLVIDIKHTDFQRLAYKRDAALTLGQLFSTDDDFVPARLKQGDRLLEANIRLKGDVVDHLQTEKWSLRIKIKGDDAYEGMTAFSIQHPKTRNYLSEWFFYEALKREGIIAPRFRFVDATINGKHKGLYALEEHFTKQLVESNKRREGPIIKFDESHLWDRWEDHKLFPKAEIFSDAVFTASQIDTFQPNKIQADSVLQRHFVKSVGLLEDFRAGAKSTSEIFDVALLAKHMAVSELIGALHGARWGNLRFYFNPITSRLEPIGYDGFQGPEILLAERLWATIPARQVLFPYDQLQVVMLRDPVFYEAYLHELERVSRPAYLDSLFSDLRPQLEKQLDILHREYPAYEFPYETFYENQKFLRYILYPSEGLRAHLFSHDADSIRLELGATQAIPVEVNAMLWGDSVIVPLSDRKLLTGKREREAIVFSDIAFPLPAGMLLTDSTLSNLAISYNVLGSDSVRKAHVVPHPGTNRADRKNDPTRRDENTRLFPFLDVDHGTRSINVKPGVWSISESMILPEGYTLHAGPGTAFDLTGSALILARGPLDWQGEAEAPIRVYSSDSSGQGLVVLNAGRESRLNHTIFENLGSADQEGWALTGAVTFHGSPIIISNTRFERSRSEDALNIVNTSFSMDSVFFAHTASDAFDADFTTGEIRNAVFSDSYNDAIDISGSEIALENIRITQAGDKALSAGEFSRMKGRRIEILQSEIAVASKDMSSIILAGGRIADTRVGFAIFQKKPEYGPATAEIDGMELENIDTPTLLEYGSSLLLNSERIAPARDRVNDILYGNLYGKASK